MNQRNRVNRKNRQAAFSLLELLTVVSIILIVTAIAVPKFLKARATASETSAASTMRSLNTSIFMYLDSQGQYPAAITNLGGAAPCVRSLATGCVMEDATVKLLASGTYSGYQWTYALNPTTAGFTLAADPLTTNNAVRHFFLDENGTIKYSDTAAASTSSPPLGN